MSKVYEVAAVVESLDGVKEQRFLDAIESEGFYWLVPLWIEDTKQKLRKPGRAIRLDGLKPLPRGPQDDVDFFVPQIMSTSLLFETPSAEEARQYVIHDSPDLTFASQNAGKTH
jgi:hypothetical protein